MAVSPEKIGEIAVDKTFDKKMLIVPGTLSGAVAFLIRILPRRMISWIYYKAAPASERSGPVIH
jgi:short-subunit dehydrogenase